MISVRESVFETNSSSVHSLTLTSKSEYTAWKKGDAIMAGEGNLIPFTELYDTIKKCKKDLVKFTSVDKDQFLALSKEIILEDANGDFDNSYYGDHYYIGKDGKAPKSSEEIENWEAKKPVADILIGYADEGYVTEEKYYEQAYYETFCYEKTIDGVDVVAFGYYGHD